MTWVSNRYYKKFRIAVTGERNTKASLNKKIVIPAIAAAAAAILIGWALSSPSFALAQQQQANSSNPAARPGGGNASAPATTNNSNGAITNNQTLPKIIGSVNLPQIIKDNIKVTLSDAANAAQKEIAGGTVVGGHLGIAQGYLVYKLAVVDSANQNVHIVIVDAGNGHVLYTSPAHPIGYFGEHHFGFGAEHHWMNMHGFGGGMWKQQHLQGQMQFKGTISGGRM